MTFKKEDREVKRNENMSVCVEKIIEETLKIRYEIETYESIEK
ncbi:12823_t:CDS:1, partial [Dentiscutata heterogama]